MKIMAAIFSQESNTFSPLLTEYDDFSLFRPVDGEDSLCRDLLPSLEPLNIWQQCAEDAGHTLCIPMAAFAHPSGPVRKEVYESLRNELLALLTDDPAVDILLLSLHGAMVAQGYQDCEGDLLSRLREVLDDRVTIAIELDLHAHLSDAVMAAADIIISYKHYPHIDIAERGAELFDMAVATCAGQLKPVMAKFDCRMLGLYPTTGESFADFLQTRVANAEQSEGVLSVSLIHSFPWGDVAEAGSQLLVITDNQPVLAERLARELGLQWFNLRHKLGFPSLSIDELTQQLHCLHAERSAATRPLVIADQSDNTGAGAPGDATYVLRWCLQQQYRDIAIAAMFDPEVVAQAHQAGVDAELTVVLGGKLSEYSGQPVALRVKVLALQNNYQHAWPQQQGQPIMTPAGNTAALRVLEPVSTGLDIIVSSQRCECVSPCIFSDHGVAIDKKFILITKSMQNFYSAFLTVARDIIYLAAPGAVTPDVSRINYQVMPTENKFPWRENPHHHALE